MKQLNNFKAVRRTGYTPLPKDAYVLKILGVKLCNNNSGNGQHFKVQFDIAEGEFEDFYLKAYEANTNEDKKWSNDGVITVSCPDDNSPQWMLDKFGEFVAAIEDSNTGYHWNWDENSWKGKLIGGLFRIEQTEYNGNVYDHTRPFWYTAADKVRSKKFGKLPNDKLVTRSAAPQSGSTADSFMEIPAGTPEEIPFD